MELSATSLLLLALAGISMGGNVPPPPPPAPRVTNAPPPLAEFLKQKEQNEASVKTDSPAAPPPVSEYRRPPEERMLAAKPTPGMARPDESRWDLPLGYNAQNLGSQEDPNILKDIVYDVNVGQKGLTAVKDDDLQACFIDHFIVPFIVPREQRRFYTHTLPGMLVDTPKDRYVYKSLVGRPIYDMCHHLRTYWLDNGLLFRYNKLLQDSFPSENNSPSFMDDVSQQGDDVIKPPPPVSLYHVLQQQEKGRNKGSSPTLHLAPPPVDQYRRLRSQS